MTENIAIKVSNLEKSFGKVKVLEDINFSVKKGEILALLGPNGAGKTTTIKMLSTLLKPDSGKLEVNGFDPIAQSQNVRASIGLTGQFAAVDEYLSGRENLEMIGRLYHLSKDESKKRAEELLQHFDLTDDADRVAKTYSGGMKRKLDLAMSLINNPKVLFLDEPTTGLDPRSRIELWNRINDLAQDGTSILLTTQQMEEAEYLADNIIVIDNGKVIAEGTVNELKARTGAEQVEITLKDSTDFNKTLELLTEELTENRVTNTITFSAKSGVKSLNDALNLLEKAEVSVDIASLRRPTLDDVFLALTGHVAEPKDQRDNTSNKKEAK